MSYCTNTDFLCPQGSMVARHSVWRSLVQAWGSSKHESCFKCKQLPEQLSRLGVPWDSCGPPLLSCGVQPGFVNSLAFATSGRFLLAGGGQVRPPTIALAMFFVLQAPLPSWLALCLL